MTVLGFQKVIAAPAQDRLDLFLGAAQRLGTSIHNIEKDFWVCWGLNTLYHGLPPGSPRMLFKGGTSLEKAYGLIGRFSEDIDITIFRDDLGQTVSVEHLETLSRKKRAARLETLKDTCRAYISGSLHEALSKQLALFLEQAGIQNGRVELDSEDPDGQTLLIWYPSIIQLDSFYVRPVVRIECGAKSALDPHCQLPIIPYIAHELPTFDLTVKNVNVIEPARTFWDKVVILHGLRRWYEFRGEVRQEGQRISRHYYDLHCLWKANVGNVAAMDMALGIDCVRHARMFFERKDFDLASAMSGSFSLRPTHGMVETLKRDFINMAGMIFGTVPEFGTVLQSIAEIEEKINRTEKS